MPQRLAVGMDVGSTTVKAVVVDLDSSAILWRDYRRHETRQPEMVMDFLVRIGEAFPAARDVSIYVTGSGSGPLAEPLGGRFVQEVNAVALAVSHLHPDVNSVVELGGQDAKIVLFREQPDEQGAPQRQALTSMNDKCASGTGATIDKCLIKVGMSAAELSNLVFDPSRLHRVAAKCGVFAETDIVNLVKSGIPAGEIMNSLADAIVHQNLSVLTRGSTLRPKVLLLGGPNSYLPFLVECWRLRIPETWRQRGVAWPEDVPIQELVFTPKDAQYYAAFGAVLFGQREQAPAVYRGLDGLKAYLANGRAARLGGNAAGPLLKSQEELEEFLSAYTLPAFTPATLTAGQTVRAVIGLDGGSTSSKAVVVGEDGGVLYKAYRLSKGNPIQDTKEILAEIATWFEKQGARLECLGFGATGYAAGVLEESLRADVNIVETVAHMTAALSHFPDADVVCDIGGQDIKVLFLRETPEGRDVKDFRLSNQCSAGNGMLLQAMADQFGVPLPDYSRVAFSAELSPRFSYGCAVFLDADRVNFQKEGFRAGEMLAGLAQVLPKNVWQYVVQVPRLAQFGRVFVLQGGTQKNLAAVKAQIDYIRQRVPDAVIHVHPHCGEAGAIGAAMETLRVVTRRGHSTFIGLQQAIALSYTARNDETTRCHFCPNECGRTFIDTFVDNGTPDGRTSRYISGFSCEKGTVESKEALKVLARERAVLKAKHPNLVALEAELAFGRFFTPRPFPDRGVTRSHADLSKVKVGLPRVLNMYSVAPFFRAFFETLGMPSQNVVWSPPTSEELWAEGGRYGSIDPCFPSKVTQAHVHELLFHAHPDPRRGPLDYIYFPCITHVPSWVTSTMDNASCPIVAGNPNVVKAAFTKETDFFAQRGIEYLDAAISFAEPNLLKRRMFETWGPRLGVTEDEVEWAVDQGFAALDELSRLLEEKGRAILEQVEREHRVAILVLGRPYHSDPGLNHGIPEEFQVLGYPVLSIRSIPKDPAFLARFFGADDPFDIRDVWPENYSANSAQKVWAVRFAARHPNVAMLDLSSFKCGHDAPTYGIVEKIVGTSKVPWSALHDIDANKPGGSIAIRVKTYAYRLKRVEEELREKAGLRDEPRKQWTEPIHGAAESRAADRPHTTLLLGGLTLAHDSLVGAALRGLGYAVELLPCPDNTALQYGKEFGNRGQCNPTYYTVGNLVKHLTRLRDVERMPLEEIRKRYVFLTAGACGPCRFGMYVTEYRKALRDAGFEGFRVLLIQQQGGIKQASGDAGLKIDRALSLAIVRAILAADVLNLLGYRLRPYELQAGATDRALAECRQILGACFLRRGSVIAALHRCRRVLSDVGIDRTRLKPVVSIVGEFWAMTTEGDGNYELQRFLEREGAEVDIQGVVNWLLFMLWENEHDTRLRLSLKRDDGGRKGLSGKHPRRKLWLVRAAELALRATFQTYANVLGLHRYQLPDMDEIASLARDHYDVNVRGGEGHMEVGKLIHFVKDRVNHMTISVKPFGCMPSGGVSDGVQAAVQARYPSAIFLAIETTGDGKVNVQSRIQMMLFKARERARGELEQALAATRMDEASFHSRVAGSKRWRFPFRRPSHRTAAGAANLVYALTGR